MEKISAKAAFEKYAYYRFCGDYSPDCAIKPSLKMLGILSKTDESKIADLPFKDAIALMLPKIPEKYRDKVAQIETTLNRRYKIDRDCEDIEFINQVAEDFYRVLKFIPKDSANNHKIRQEIYSNLYDLDEQKNPFSQRNRFNILVRSVDEIPNRNDGTFDHTPLNVVARQVDFFMKDIPARERLSLINKIERKTFNHEQYNYTRQIKELDYACFIAKQEEKLNSKELKQERYAQIRNHALPQAQTVAEQISLYNELLGLVNSQDWGRGHKFDEKKTICNHLINLYGRAGMFAEMEKAKAEREKYVNAGNICREAAKIKGYKPGNGHGR